MAWIAFVVLFCGIIYQVNGECDNVQIVSRAEWGARPPRGTRTALHLPTNMTFVHHTAMAHCTTQEACSAEMKVIQNLHMDANGWDDIGYNFLVGEDGRVYEGRGWENRGAHSPIYNALAHGTSIMGNYMTVAPNQAALDATQALIKCGVDEHYILPDYELFGHRDGRCTECPGDKLYSLIQEWPNYSHREIPVWCPSQPVQSTDTTSDTQGECDNVQIVSRSEWGARPPRGTRTALHLPTNMTFVHHTAMAHCTTQEACSAEMKVIQDLHMDTNGWDDIGYNFLVGEDGRVYEGRGWENRGAHSPIYNALAHGTSIMGNYMTVAPNQAALDATQALIKCGVDEHYIMSDYELFGHRDGRCTECPGDKLYSLIQEWPNYSHREIPVWCPSQPVQSTDTTSDTQGECDNVQIVSRAEWGARPPRGTYTALHLPTNMTFVHHTAMAHCTTQEACSAEMKVIQNLHMDTNGWDDIGYNFLVGEDGRVYEGRGWENKGAHSPIYNALAHGTSIMGNYMTVAPNQAALDATQALIQCGLDEHYILPDYELFGHRDGRCTECPGDKLYSLIQEWPKYSHREIPVWCPSQPVQSTDTTSNAPRSASICLMQCIVFLFIYMFF